MTAHDHIDELKAAADPVRVAEHLGLEGRGSRFRCPFCVPSGGKLVDLSLSVGDYGFLCHRCGVKGDVLKLVEVFLNVDFPSAVAWLEEETGIRPPERHKAKSKKNIGNHTGSEPYVHPGASYAIRTTTTTKTTPDPSVYEAFLSSCRHVEGPALDWLIKDKGVAPQVIVNLGLRYCGGEYWDVIDALKIRFGEDALKVAGLLKPSRKTGRLVPSFWHYYASKTPFLVIPYMKDGRPVYLKIRPPISKEEAERRELVRFMNTGGTIPCLYNVDVLKDQKDRVLICEGESDTWSALSSRYIAVGSPGAKGFKTAWVEDFRGIVDKDGRSKVDLVMAAD